MKKLSIFLFFLFSLSFESGAQLRFGRLSTDKGLSQATVYCSYQDSEGFMWFGTEDGLNKYDGYTFEIYKSNPSDTNTISNNVVRCIFEDSKKNLWIGTDNGLNIYKRSNGSFIRYANNPKDASSISNNFIYSICEDKQGTIWIGTSSGLNSFNNITKKFSVYKNELSKTFILSSNFITSLHCDKEGKLWVGTFNNGVNVFDPNTKQVNTYTHNAGDIESLGGNEITSITEDKTGTIWIGMLNSGFNSFNPSSKKFTRYNNDESGSNSAGTSVFSICEDESGNMWFGSSGGLIIYNPQSKKIIHCKHDAENIESVISNKIWNVFEDHAGTMWMATVAGVSFYNVSVAKFITIKNISGGDSIANNNVFSVYEDGDGLIWCGILGSGLNLFDRKQNRFTNDKIMGNDLLLHSSDIFSIAGDKGNTLWLGTSDGLIEYNKISGKIVVYKNEEGNSSSINNNSIRSIAVDANDVVWIATQGGGLNRFDKTSGKFFSYRNNLDDASSISHDVVMSLMNDGNLLWIATYGGGLNVLDKRTEKFTVYKNDSHNPASISSNFVNCIYKDKKGGYWVGTYGGGLNSFSRSSSSFKSFSEGAGLPNNIINGIQEDDKGALWISTNNGMCKFSPQAINQTDLILKTRTYNQQDGMQNKFNENACANGGGGWMYFGGSNGLNAFHPDSIKDNTVVPPVVITHFFLFEKPQRMDTLITTDKTLKLNYRQNFFSFDFAALNFLFPEKNHYAYMMEGLDTQWIYISDYRRYQSYTNLDPGDYTFRVKASNNDGYWNEEGVAIKITIAPPFWKTWWFMILSVVSITLVIVLYIRFRTRTLVKQTVQLEEKVQQRTSELSEKNNQLTTAMNDLSATQNQLVQSEKMASLGQLTAGIAHEIQNPLNFVNNFSELSIELLEDMETVPHPDEQEPVIADLKQNLGKILIHGKRADSIVKGMLMHSRAGSAEKQLSDINKLVSEFVDLAYHGMRAKDPGFNCTMEKNLGKEIPAIKILPQDVSRVILNIFNNAFYAVEERKKTGEKNYKPTVSVRTTYAGEKIFIAIRDNGKGIPVEVKDKIFNPFFTTKPTGQGTGLGLSISYDIIAKGHGGELKVDSKAGEFTEFTVVLPLT